MYYPMYYMFDPTYVLILIGVLISLGASARLRSTYQQYAGVRSRCGITGEEAARQLLRSQGIYDVTIRRVPGNLTDHYNPGKKTLGLSDTVYNSASVAAIGVAAHECGHAVQHATGYAPLKIRGALVPAANFGSMAAWPLILIGLLMNGDTAILFINLGILVFSAAVLFQIVTLPVEFNASRRAVRVLESSGMLYPDEVDSVKKVLSAAALTYVASAASMILQLLRLIIIGGRKRND